jgi:hypothetical protein
LDREQLICRTGIAADEPITFVRLCRFHFHEPLFFMLSIPYSNPGADGLFAFLRAWPEFLAIFPPAF